MLDFLDVGAKMAWRPAMAGLAAAAEAMFPEGVGDAPDWKSTRLVERTLDYLDELPPPQRRLLVLLYAAVELGSGLTLPRGRRFSKLSVSEREDALRRWRNSPFLPVSILGDAVKANMTMMYMSHPDVLTHIGMYKTCAYPDDELIVTVRPDALHKARES